MNSTRLLALVTGAVIVSACGSTALAAVGARVIVQEWLPTQPDRTGGRIVFDDPDLVSRTLSQNWANARSTLCSALNAKLGASRAVAGQTLYDIDCRIDPAAALSVVAAGPNTISVVFAILGNSISATSTQPTVLGKDFDPRFSLTLDATLAVTLAAQADPNNILRVTQARFTLGNARIDSHNASGDVTKFVGNDLSPFFGGPNFKQLAENAVNGVSLDLAAQFNGAMAPINARLRGPSDHLRVGVWAYADRIAVAFSPREISPPGGGTISGVLRWDPAEFQAAPNCSSFGLQASVQTGPGALLSPSDFNQVGPAPMRNVGSVSMVPAGGHACRFSINGVPAGWPSHIATWLEGGKAVGSASSLYSVRLALKPDGWSGPVVANASNKNFLVARELRGTAVERQVRRRNPLDPVANTGVADRVQPQVRALEPARAPAVATPRASTSGASIAAPVQPALRPGRAWNEAAPARSPGAAAGR